MPMDYFRSDSRKSRESSVRSLVQLMPSDDCTNMTPNRVRAIIADRPPHTTEHAGSHSAVQAGWEMRELSLKAGSMTLRREVTTCCRSVFVEAVIPPPCPSWSVLRSVLRGQATMTSADCCSGLREDYSSPQSISVARHFPGRGAALPG